MVVGYPFWYTFLFPEGATMTGSRELLATVYAEAMKAT